MSVNRVFLTGNLTRDIEVRHTASGLPVGSFGVAVNDRRKNQQGEWEDYPNFFECTMFGTRAESISGLIGKGSKVAIEGKLRHETWDRDGQKRSKVSVIVDEVEFMSRQERGGANGAVSAETAPQNGSHGLYDSRYADSDLPF